MLLIFPEGPVEVDGVSRLRDLKINIDQNAHKARIKLIYTKQGTEHPLDLLIQSWSFPTWNWNSDISVRVNGIEQEARLSFRLTLAWNMITGRKTISGVVGSRQIKRELTDSASVIDLVKEFYCS